MIYIKDVLTKWVNSRPDKEYNYISPSSLGGCNRAHYFKIKGVKQTTPPSESALLNFQMGFVWEEVIKKALDELKIPYKFQEYFEDKELNTGGTIDFMLPADLDNLYPQHEALDVSKMAYKAGARMPIPTIDWKSIETVIHDSKTMASKWFWYLEKSNKDFGLENEHYLYQLGLYIILARRAGYNCNKGLLTFISKDDSMVGKEYEFTLTPEWEEKILTRVKRLNANLKANKLPPCECENWRVAYCGFGDPATREVNKTKKLVNTSCCSEKLMETVA